MQPSFIFQRAIASLCGHNTSPPRSKPQSCADTAPGHQRDGSSRLQCGHTLDNATQPDLVPTTNPDSGTAPTTALFVAGNMSACDSLRVLPSSTSVCHHSVQAPSCSVIIRRLSNESTNSSYRPLRLRMQRRNATARHHHTILKLLSIPCSLQRSKRMARLTHCYHLRWEKDSWPQ